MVVLSTHTNKETGDINYSAGHSDHVDTVLEGLCALNVKMWIGRTKWSMRTSVERLSTIPSTGPITRLDKESGHDTVEYHSVVVACRTSTMPLNKTSLSEGERRTHPP